MARVFFGGVVVVVEVEEEGDMVMACSAPPHIHSKQQITIIVLT